MVLSITGGVVGGGSSVAVTVRCRRVIGDLGLGQNATRPTARRGLNLMQLVATRCRRSGVNLAIF